VNAVTARTRRDTPPGGADASSCASARGTTPALGGRNPARTAATQGAGGVREFGSWGQVLAWDDRRFRTVSSLMLRRVQGLDTGLQELRFQGPTVCSCVLVKLRRAPQTVRSCVPIKPRPKTVSPVRFVCVYSHKGLSKIWGRFIFFGAPLVLFFLGLRPF